MLVLGTTADDKGAQLEALIAKLLISDGYEKVRRNYVSAGANEIDVSAEQPANVLGKTQATPVHCEAKAYRDPLSMPAWQRFLGKVFLGRLKQPRLIGVLVALNGVNGNVAGSYEETRAQDQAVLVIEGVDLERQLIASGELSSAEEARVRATQGLHREVRVLDSAYYDGGFYWFASWPETGEYAALDSHGTALPAERVEALRAATETTLSGTLLLPDEAQIRADELHDARLALLNRLFDEKTVPLGEVPDISEEVISQLANEPFCRADDQALELVAAGELDAAGVRRLFEYITAGTIRVERLDFMKKERQRPYVERLIEYLPTYQAGFTLSQEDEQTLRTLAPVFPSLWMRICTPIAEIVTHRATQPEVTFTEAILATDRNTFWEVVTYAVERDFTNVKLRGLLFDHLGVAEIEKRTEYIIKSKQKPLGAVTVELRNVIGQLSDEWVSEEGSRHIIMRALPTAPEPWEQEHPDPIT